MHDLNNIEPLPGVEAFDAAIDTPGLHKLARSVNYRSRASILPPDLREALPQLASSHVTALEFGFGPGDWWPSAAASPAISMHPASDPAVRERTATPSG